MARITLVLLMLAGSLLSFAQENLKNPVIVIEAGEDFQRQTGSGVLLGKEGNTLFFATAAHVVNNPANLSVRFRTRATPVEARIVKINAQLDLAVISCTQPAGFQVPNSFEIYEDDIQPEQEVIVIGHPSGNEWDINRRVAIKELDYDFDDRMFTLYAGSINPGNSGGPVLSQDQRWIGMAQEINNVKGICLMASTIRRVCQSWAVPLNLLNGKNISIQGSYTDPLIGEMIFVEGGSFDMGSNEGGDDEKPVHRVSVPDFYMGKFEITQVQWQEIMGNIPNPSKDCDQCPVHSVSWNDIQKFLQKLNAKSRYTYRLPTEAEWEYAAGGGRENRTAYAGTDDIDQLYRFGNYCDESCDNWHIASHPADGFPLIAPVGSFLPNRLGLYDMSGNVWEWCEDWYHKTYAGAPANGAAWLSPAGTGRVLRGGSWYYDPQDCRISNRFIYTPGYAMNLVGFRLARTP